MVGAAIVGHSVQGRSPPRKAARATARIQVANGLDHQEEGAELISRLRESTSPRFSYEVCVGEEPDWVLSIDVEDDDAHEVRLIIWLVCAGCRASAIRSLEWLAMDDELPPIVFYDVIAREAVFIAPASVGLEVLKETEFFDRIDDIIESKATR